MAPADSRTTDGARERTPQLVAGVDIRGLPIGPEEAFVLSRIDGVSSLSDLAAATNFASADVARIVARLVTLGAIRLEAEPAAHSERQLRPTPTRSGAYRIGPISETSGASTSPHPAAVDEGGRTSEEPVDLEPEQQRNLLDLYQRLDSLDHYELLSVAPSTDDKQIRAAYYELVRVYHPDRFFGKNLGSFKPKLAKLFGRLTEAYEALHRSASRAEYDRYLAARQRTLDFEQQFDKGRQAAEVASAMARIEQAARADSLRAPQPSVAPTSVAPSSVAPTSVPPASVPPASSGSSSSRHSLLPPSEAARRRALARKLGHSSAPPPRTPSAPPPSASALAAGELKRRYESRLMRARQEQQTHYEELSEAAVTRNDLAAAANALRIASSLAPENEELASRLAELEGRAAAELWEAYVERGKYAAFDGRFAEAAESYERAAVGRPIAVHFERAAFYMLEAEGDLKRATFLAKQAVSLAPSNAKCRLTLAQVYVRTKLRESALAELERARALDPEQPLIKEWILRVKRGDV